MHEACYRVLAYCLTRKHDVNGIKKGPLYRAIYKSFLDVDGSPSWLEVDYGDCEGREQGWAICPGYEVRSRYEDG